MVLENMVERMVEIHWKIIDGKLVIGKLLMHSCGFGTYGGNGGRGKIGISRGTYQGISVKRFMGTWAWEQDP